MKTMLFVALAMVGCAVPTASEDVGENASAETITLNQEAVCTNTCRFHGEECRSQPQLFSPEVCNQNEERCIFTCIYACTNVCRIQYDACLKTTPPIACNRERMVCADNCY